MPRRTNRRLKRVGIYVVLKVLHVNDYRTLGGCEVLIDTTIRLLRDRGIEAELFSIEDVRGHRRSALRYVANRRCAAALLDRIERYRPDVVHLHNFYHELSPGILAVLRSWKRHSHGRVVMTAHDYHLICPNSGLCEYQGRSLRAVDPARTRKLSYLLSRRWDHRSLGHSTLKLIQHLWNYRLRSRRSAIDLVICPSRYMQNALEPIGVATAFVPHPAPKITIAGKKPQGELRWVFAGRIEPEKGLAELLNILPADFPGRLTMIGEGSEALRCAAICQRRGIAERIEFAGRLEPSVALHAIADSHVLLLPSLCPENAPMSLIEALAARTNILVSDLGGMKEIVETSGIGFTFTLGDAASLAKAVGTIEECYQLGDLNTFSASIFLAQRDESAYCDGIMQAYRGTEDDR